MKFNRQEEPCPVKRHICLIENVNQIIKQVERQQFQFDMLKFFPQEDD